MFNVGKGQWAVTVQRPHNCICPMKELPILVHTKETDTTHFSQKLICVAMPKVWTANKPHSASHSQTAYFQTRRERVKLKSDRK